MSVIGLVQSHYNEGDYNVKLCATIADSKRRLIYGADVIVTYMTHCRGDADAHVDSCTRPLHAERC